MDINNEWFSISSPNEKEKEKEKEKIDERFKKMEEKIRELENLYQDMRTENLKLVNRILEAEISLERSKNLLLRKNISFPFTLVNKML